MKRLIATAIALTFTAGSAAMAQPHPDNRGNDRGHDRPRVEQKGPQRYARGQRLPSTYRGDNHRVKPADYRRHGLRQPPRGYRWQKINNDYVLMAITSGLIAEVIAGR